MEKDQGSTALKDGDTPAEAGDLTKDPGQSPEEKKASADKATKEAAAKAKARAAQKAAKEAPPVKKAEGGRYDNKVKVDLNALPKVKIKIHSIADNPEGKSDETVTCNGRAYLIKRDQVVEVPDAILEILDHAKEKHYELLKREDGGGNELVEYEVQRFPYTVVQ